MQRTEKGVNSKFLGYLFNVYLYKGFFDLVIHLIFIATDKTMDVKLMNIPNDDKLNYPFFVKNLDTTLLV